MISDKMNENTYHLSKQTMILEPEKNNIKTSFEPQVELYCKVMLTNMM